MTAPHISEQFIRENTRLLSPPLVPEICLHLAEESVPIWQKTEEELGEIGLPPPYWAFAWAGGQALARYVLDNAGLVSGKRVLDLGSGSGLSAIAAMKAGAASALAADVDLVALTFAVPFQKSNSISVSPQHSGFLASPAVLKKLSVLIHLSNGVRMLGTEYVPR